MAVGIGGFALLVVGLVAFVALGGKPRPGAELATDLGGIKRQVAADAVAQYQIAKRNGDATQACVQAGLVVAAYLQAHDEPSYVKWRAVEAADCKAAGLQ